ncbi:MAG: hypothetical protein HYV07_09250 [Deltaproteobacteria bacterium]|nr:hypothetical protein [Deltaproteobacteria bacterium]
MYSPPEPPFRVQSEIVTVPSPTESSRGACPSSPPSTLTHPSGNPPLLTVLDLASSALVCVTSSPEPQPKLDNTSARTEERMMS